MTNQLRVRADPDALLRNILNYFGDGDAYIQELLQNARRAEASEVTVEIDTQAGTLTVSDNGHGVLDPQDLLNIGRSEWNDSVVAERPAGMGLFSVFKLGQLAEIRSGRWKLTLDYDEMCRGKPAIYEGLQHDVKGTRIRVHGFHEPLGAPDNFHPEGFASRWAREAEFMPFRTSVILDGSTRTVEPFNPLVVADGVLRVETSWGWVDLHTKSPSRGRSADHATLVQQGVELEIKHKLYFPSQHVGPWVRIFCKPGTVNFTLPDRDRIQDDGQYRLLLKEVKQACVEAVINRIDSVDESAQRRLTSVVYGWDKLRAVELPAKWQRVLVHHDRQYLQPTTRETIAKMLDEGYLPCSFRPTYDTAFELVPYDLLSLPTSEVALFKAMFPDVPIVTDVRFDITADDRSDLLWHAGDITLSFDNEEKRVVQPVPDRCVLTGGDLDAEFIPDNRERADFRSGYDFAVIHSGDVVTCPDLAPWYDFHEEGMDSEQADELWRTSKYAVHIASTWPGVPSDDLTLDELHTLLLDRYGGRFIQLKNADLKPAWGNRVSIESVTVEFIEVCEERRTLQFKSVDGFLKEVTS